MSYFVYLNCCDIECFVYEYDNGVIGDCIDGVFLKCGGKV